MKSRSIWSLILIFRSLLHNKLIFNSTLPEDNRLQYHRFCTCNWIFKNIFYLNISTTSVIAKSSFFLLIVNFTSIGFAIQFLALFIWYDDDDARNAISIKYKKQTKLCLLHTFHQIYSVWYRASNPIQNTFEIKNPDWK